MPKLKRSVLSADVKPETLEKLKQICKDENKSQAKILEAMIDNWGSQPPAPKHECTEPKMKAVVFVPKEKTKPSLVIKATPKRFNLSEELAKLK